MQTQIDAIAGDTPGTSHSLVVHHFAGTDASAPKAYLQAALHGAERPGVAALHYLMPMLAAAERNNRLRGDVTIVPQANPIAASQHMMSQHMGRFAFGTRVNFNREFPVPGPDGVVPLDRPDAPVFAERRLKSRLLDLASGADIVLDLHCDDEGLSYLYVADALWPGLADLARCLQAEAVIRWHAMPDRAFEEAVFARMCTDAGGAAALGRRCVTTVEFRGEADVDPSLARTDALGLYCFLAGRGVIDDPQPATLALAPDFPAAPISHVEMIHAPAGGTLLFHVRPGDRVTEGDLLAEILVRPGEDGGTVTVHAPQAGLILTRRSRRFIRTGDDLIKLVGVAPSASARDGTLEAR